MTRLFVNVFKNEYNILKCLLGFDLVGSYCIYVWLYCSLFIPDERFL